MNPMDHKISNYRDGRLSPEDIAQGKHRADVGGMWDELGTLQFNFLLEQGLEPSHKFLDIGCGCLRGGLHIIRFLDPGHYYGIDIDSTLLAAGMEELRVAGIADKEPHLLASDRFGVSAFAAQFDLALAFSVFTHLPMNGILRCMAEVSHSLRPKGRFFATYFEAPQSLALHEITQSGGNVVSSFDRDPYHYSREELTWMAQHSGLACRFVSEFDCHPRGQKMCELSLRQ